MNPARLVVLWALLQGAAGCQRDGGADTALVLRACVVAATCSVGPGISLCLQSLGENLDDPARAGTGADVARPPLSDQVSCLAAGSPTAEEACRLVERCQRGSTATACGAAPPGCDGDVAQGCDERAELTRVDCAHVGLTCVDFPGGVQCGLASCEADELVPTCQGDLAVRCQDRVLTLAIDCGARELRCAVVPSVSGTCGSSSVTCGPDSPCTSVCDKGRCRFAAQLCGVDKDCADVVVPECVQGDRATCQGDGPECQAGLSAARCEGDDRVTCEGGREQRTPCSRIPGARCQEGRCVADAQCQAGEHTDRCEGDQLVVCQAGRVSRLSCSELGLGACSEGRCGPVP